MRRAGKREIRTEDERRWSLARDGASLGWNEMRIRPWQDGDERAVEITTLRSALTEAKFRLTQAAGGIRWRQDEVHLRREDLAGAEKYLAAAQATLAAAEQEVLRLEQALRFHLRDEGGEL